MNDEVIKLLAERFLGTTEELPSWAIKCLERGYDSKCLRILASMSKWDSISELSTYFQRSLKELSWDKISQTEYLVNYTKILAKEIIEEKTDPIKASREIYRILVELHYPAELQGWFEIDEMIFDYEHFIETGQRGYFYRTKDQLLNEIKAVSKALINQWC